MITCLARTPLLAMLLLALVTAACADGEPSPEVDAGDDTGSEASAETVRMITHDSFAISDATLEAFTDETGIEVEVVASGDAGAALNQAALTAGDPQGDVFFGVDNTFLSRALDEEVFTPYESPELDAVDERFVLDDEHRVTPIDYGDVCLNYDKAYFEDADVEVPKELADLTDPAYEGLLVVENPATSSPGLAFMLATIAELGDGWEDWWSQLADNDVAVADGWEDAYYGQFSGAAGSEGDRPLVVSYASSPPAEVEFAEEELDEAPTGVIPSSCFRQIEFAGVLAGTPKEEAARQLVDFMLSETFQADVPLNMFVFPVRDGVELPEVFVEHAEIPDDPLTVPADDIAANREQWVDTWTDVVLRR